MLDLETFGLKPGAMIRAIGAVKFQNGEILDTFYMRIDPKSCEDVGLRLDVSTMMWWMKQSDAARKEMTDPGEPLTFVLARFREWLSPGPRQVWGNGADFDNALLEAAYAATGCPAPWSYRDNRCYRTIWNLFPALPYEKPTISHHALEDAKAQAKHLIKILALVASTQASLKTAPVSAVAAPVK